LHRLELVHSAPRFIFESPSSSKAVVIRVHVVVVSRNVSALSRKAYDINVFAQCDLFNLEKTKIILLGRSVVIWVKVDFQNVNLYSVWRSRTVILSMVSKADLSSPADSVVVHRSLNWCAAVGGR